MMENFKSKLSLIVLMFLSGSLGLKSQTLNLWYKTPAEYFINALPVGNGRLAAMVYGRPAEELIHLNEESLWSGGPVNLNPNPDSPVLKITEETYEDLFGQKPLVKAIHAGLECGIIGAKYPAMDMVSFGPTIRGAHAPGERVEVASVGKAWQLLKAVLAAVPAHG